MKVYILLSACFMLAYSASAQQAMSSSGADKPSLPDPILHRVSDLTPWTVVFRSGQQNSGPQTGASKPKTTFIIKSKNIYHIIENQSNGSILDKWYVAGMLIKFPPNTEKWSMSNSDINFSQTDFPELSWLSKENYTGVQKVNGKDAYAFKTQYVIIDENGHPETFFRTATVDVETQWPIYFTDGPSAVTYQYGKPSSAPLSIPSKVSAVIAQQVGFDSPPRK